jgi:hypothetical protein
MLSETKIRETMKAWRVVDEAAERSGGYVAYYPGKKNAQEFDYRAMSRYARDKGVTSMDLSEDELKIFEFDPPLIFD